MELWCEKFTEIYNNATAANRKNPAKNLVVEIVENRTGSVRAFAPPTPKIRKNAVLLFNFFLSTKPTSRENANNSHLILFHILLVRNILRQRGRFICERFSFAFYYLLYYVVNSKVLLFANNYHLNIFRIWISFAFDIYSHLEIIRIYISISNNNHSHLIIIFICKSLAFEYHNQIIIIRIWK